MRRSSPQRSSAPPAQTMFIPNSIKHILLSLLNQTIYIEILKACTWMNYALPQTHLEPLRFEKDHHSLRLPSKFILACRAQESKGSIISKGSKGSRLSKELCPYFLTSSSHLREFM